MRFLEILFGLLCFCSVNVVFATDVQLAEVNGAPNIVLIVVDTMGAQYIGKEVGSISITPEIDKLRSEGVEFTRAYSTSPWTKPAIASMFTGVLPLEHGTMHLRSVFEPKMAVMAELLGNVGYRRAGFVSHNLIGPKTGYKRGFESYEIIKFKGNIHNAVTSDQVTGMGSGWLTEKKKEPFFLFLHYFDPHFNYQHHAKFDLSSWYKGSVTSGMGFRDLRDRLDTFNADDKRYLGDLYKEEIRYTDHNIGIFLKNLKEKGLDRNTVVILTADHGEEFFEHGSIGHTKTLYDELIHIPLIMSFPEKFKAKKINMEVTIVDLLPTICELADTDVGPMKLPGISLLPWLLKSKSDDLKRDIISEVDFKSSAIEAHKVGIIRNRFKGIFDFISGSWEFFDLSSDPSEKNPLGEDASSVFQDLKSSIQQRVDQHKESELSGVIDAGQIPEEAVSPKEVESLRSLGYM